MIPNAAPPASSQAPSNNRRLSVWYGFLIFILVIFVARLFYLQIVRHDYYRAEALADQLKEFAIPAQRGVIHAHEGGEFVPLVLNEKLYTLYVDPFFIKDAAGAAIKVAAVTSGDAGSYEKAMKTKGSRYQILARRLSQDQKKQIEALKLPGVGTQGQDYRTYPQGSLAAQVLGFVNNDGEGKYGVEQALDKSLTGTPGRLKAITDAEGVPLAASRNNIQVNPSNGKDMVLTLDLGMQKQLETILKKNLDKVSSNSGSALIMDVNTGAIKAMANLPTFDPAQYYDQSDSSVFTNAAVSLPLEVGSVMKTLTASAALDLGVIKADTTYNDPARWELDGHTITNIEEDGGPGVRSITDILNLSINTGAAWMLMRMGGQTGEVNATARDRWHDYMVNHFNLGKTTGIEQGYEAGGFVPEPNKGYALQLTYANTSFGQAMTATPLQMAAALASVINGGTYYQPRLIDGTLDSAGNLTAKKPIVVRSGVVSSGVSQSLRSMLEFAVKDHYKSGFSYLNFSDSFSVGGKTGTAQIANPSGGYYGNRFNGTYIGYVGGDRPQYVISVRVNEPHGVKYAGSGAAQPLFSDLAHMLIDNFNIVPKPGT
ncbi:penicillin-binding protein 2 [Candidatus Saccharibacteria bacterium]|nr:penicillin-binding protein 2 [Candidatus Saccharibacteria bacterium]